MTDQEETLRGTISTSRVADLLGWSRWTVWRVPSAELPFTTTRGGHRRYRREDVSAYDRARNTKNPRHPEG